MNDLPATIKVGPFVYAVVEDPVSRSYENRGEYDSTHIRINLEPTMARQRKQVTLVHELIHAIFDTQGRNRGQAVSEEEVCDFVAPALVEVLRENPDLIAYLTSSDA